MVTISENRHPSSSHDAFLAGLPGDDCRRALYTLEIRSLTADSGSDARSAFTSFFSWIPEAAPEDTSDLYYSGSDGTAMGNYDPQFTPTGIMTSKVDQVADYFMGDISDHAAVSYQALTEAARLIFRPTDAEKAEDEERIIQTRRRKEGPGPDDTLR
ncbi:hypothetical protein [Nonomuraea sp. ZG12]|uniref:hypothetical protein n=1 Tax=Nonomuraea sp. ZG12 TaxID=3452207 RepID=UPI003F8A5978